MQDIKPAQPALLGTRQLAEFLNVSEETARLLMKRGDVPGAARIGGSWRVRKEDIDALFESR